MNKLKLQVLLLNSSYEPLSIITVKRAMHLLFKNVIHVEEYKDDYIRSPKEKFQIPCVVRKKDYIDVRKARRQSFVKRARIYIRDKYRCQYCLKKCKDKDLTLDHIIPKAQGGVNTVENLVTCCLSCNQFKGDRRPEEARMKLHKTPQELKVKLEMVVNKYNANQNPTWKKYLFMSDLAEGDLKFITYEK